MPVILDAKRGDIGPTAEQYAREVFVRYRADAVTLSPLLGFDSIEPYLRHEGKGAILLCRTSNPGGADLQELCLASGERVYERIARLAAGAWNAGGQLGLVVGATYPAEIARVRELAPHAAAAHPRHRRARRRRRGDGAGGLARHGGEHDGPIIVSSSRAILYAGSDGDYAEAARVAAEAARRELTDARVE